MQNKSRKGKKRRDQAKHPNLKKAFNPRVRQEYLDFDYLEQLSEKELDWLDKTMGEYYGASFDRQHPERNIQSYEKYGKDCNDRNNARNRDLYGALKNKDNKFSNKKLVNYDNMTGEIENELSRESDPNAIENAYIEFLTFKQIEQMMLEYDLAMQNFIEVSEDLLQLQTPIPEPLVP